MIFNFCFCILRSPKRIAALCQVKHHFIVFKSIMLRNTTYMIILMSGILLDVRLAVWYFISNLLSYTTFSDAFTFSSLSGVFSVSILQTLPSCFLTITCSNHFSLFRMVVNFRVSSFISLSARSGECQSYCFVPIILYHAPADMTSVLVLFVPLEVYFTLVVYR